MGQNRAPGALDPGAAARSAASPYQKDVLTKAAERALRPWAPYGNGIGERQGAVLAHMGPAALGTGAAPPAGPIMTVAVGPGMPPTPTALYGIAPEAAKAIGEAAGRVGIFNARRHQRCFFIAECKSVAYCFPPSQVARPGTAQVSEDDAWAAVPHAVGRQLWPSDITMPPRCAKDLLVTCTPHIAHSASVRSSSLRIWYEYMV